VADDAAASGRAWDAGQCGADAAGGSGRAFAFPVSSGAPETDFVPDRRVLPSPTEIAEAIMQAGEPGTGRTVAGSAELSRNGWAGQCVCPGRFFAGVGTYPVSGGTLSAGTKSTWAESLAGLACRGATRCGNWVGATALLGSDVWATGGQ
jgi:hypothetical protein